MIWRIILTKKDGFFNKNWISIINHLLKCDKDTVSMIPGWNGRIKNDNSQIGEKGQVKKVNRRQVLIIDLINKITEERSINQKLTFG